MNPTDLYFKLNVSKTIGWIATKFGINIHAQFMISFMSSTLIYHQAQASVILLNHGHWEQTLHMDSTLDPNTDQYWFVFFLSANETLLFSSTI